MKTENAPQNGIAGLKHWRYDLSSGLQVALVSLPLSLGTAIASGAPPITGVISAIIAGLIFPFLGGAYVTISGPAAGLAPALLAGILLLGNGDVAAGYPLLLVAICLTGLVQIVLSVFKAGKLVAMFLPITVVEAMLAAIGLIIIIKQIPPLLGVISPPTKTMLLSIVNLPTYVMDLDPTVFFVGGLCLFLMFYLNRTRHAWMRRIPAPLSVCAIGLALGFILDLDPKYLIKMPEDILEGGITMPAFGEVLSRPEIWGSILIVVITLTLIDGIESLATIAAVDKIDPYQRKSDPNVTLRAMGVSNTLSSIFGGLTIIPGGIKSRANIDAGGRTLWANFYNACFLVIFLFFLKDLISHIPLAAIAAVLIYVGWRLCEPTVFSKTYSVGRDQIIIFVITIVAILMTDLLVGIIVGVIAEVLMLLYLVSPSLRLVMAGRLTFTQWCVFLGQNMRSLFLSPVIKFKEEKNGGHPHYHLSLASLVGFNLLALERTLSKVPEQANLTLALTESGRLIDHTAMEYLHQLQEESLRRGRAFTLQGMETFHPFTEHPLSARMRDAQIVKEKARRSEREQAMAEVARSYGLDFNPGKVATLNRYDFVYLRRGTDREETNVMTGTYRGCEVKLFDYSHTAAPDYYVEHRHTIIMIRIPKEADLSVPNFAVTPGSYLERYLVKYQELDTEALNELQHYRVYTEDPQRTLPLLNTDLINLLRHFPGIYLEVHDHTLLAFHPNHEIEPAENIASLLSLTDVVSSWSKQIKESSDKNGNVSISRT